MTKEELTKKQTEEVQGGSCDWGYDCRFNTGDISSASNPCTDQLPRIRELLCQTDIGEPGTQLT